jgi:hypothetical protein
VDLQRLQRDSGTGKAAAVMAAVIAKPRILRRLVVGLAAATLLIGVVTYTAWWRFSKSHTTAPAPSRPVHVTTYPGWETAATLSPDGRLVAFSGNVEAADNFDIYVKIIGAEPPLRLTRHPDEDENPIWSPDGRWIAFTRDRKKVLLVSPLGGMERTIAERALTAGSKLDTEVIRMAEVWWGFQHFVTFGGRIPIGWAGVTIVAACGLWVLGRLSTHSFGPLSGLLVVIWYIVFLKWAIGGVADHSARSIIMFYPKAFVALLVLLFILNVRRAELDANQRRRNRRSAEEIASALRQVAVQTPDAPTQRNAPTFSLYLRPFVSTNELPVQFDHGRNIIVGERIDLENILRLSLGRSGLWLANCYGRADFTGAAQVNWPSLSERIRWQ